MFDTTEQNLYVTGLECQGWQYDSPNPCIVTSYVLLSLRTFYCYIGMRCVADSFHHHVKDKDMTSENYITNTLNTSGV